MPQIEIGSANYSLYAIIAFKTYSSGISISFFFPTFYPIETQQVSQRIPNSIKFQCHPVWLASLFTVIAKYAVCGIESTPNNASLLQYPWPFSTPKLEQIKTNLFTLCPFAPPLLFLLAFGSLIPVVCEQENQTKTRYDDDHYHLVTSSFVPGWPH